MPLPPPHPRAFGWREELKALGEENQTAAPDKMAGNDSIFLPCTHFIKHRPREDAYIGC